MGNTQTFEPNSASPSSASKSSFFVCNSNAKLPSHHTHKKHTINKRTADTVCTHCAAPINSNYYDLHLQSCAKKGKNNLTVCTFCKGHFDSASYEKHIGNCQNSLQNLVTKCKHCNGKFNGVTLAPHIDNCQANPKNIRLPCEYCRKLVKPEFFQSHTRKCAEISSFKKVKCENCYQQFTKAAIVDHYNECTPKFELVNPVTDSNINVVSVIETQEPQDHDESNDIGVDKQCAICLEDMERDCDVRYLQCFHRFHKHCIQDWSKKQKLCPLCQIEFE